MLSHKTGLPEKRIQYQDLIAVFVAGGLASFFLPAMVLRVPELLVVRGIEAYFSTFFTEGAQILVRNQQ